MKNTEVSRLLGDLWRNTPAEEKRPYIEKEKAEREQYKIAMAEWRKEFEAKQEEERKAQHQQLTMAAADPSRAGFSPYADPMAFGYPAGATQPYMHHHQQYAFGKSCQGFIVGSLGRSCLMFLLVSAGYPGGPYAFPTDGKQPVILGPSGTPVDPNFATNAEKDATHDVKAADNLPERPASPGFAYQGDM